MEQHTFDRFSVFLLGDYFSPIDETRLTWHELQISFLCAANQVQQ